MKHTFIREKSLTAINCRYKEVSWFEYSEEEQEAVRRTRRTKARASPPKVKKMNDEYSRQYFRWLLFNNFGKGDYHVTLTFADEFTTEDAKREVTNYLRRLRRLYGKQNLELKYLLIKEDRRSGHRLHWHLVLNGGAIDRDAIENQWKLGYANADRLKPDAKDGLYGLARYLTKSMAYCEKHQRSWVASGNLLRPDKNPDMVTDDNKISKRRMKQLQEAARNDEVKAFVERMYKGFEIIQWRVGVNEVTGRTFAKFCLMRRSEATGGFGYG